MQVEAHTGDMPAEFSFVSLSAGKRVLTAMKKAEDSDALIFHMYEWAGKDAEVSLKVPQGATGAMETNLMEQPGGSLSAIENDSCEDPIRPYEIFALRVDYAHHEK